MANTFQNFQETTDVIHDDWNIASLSVASDKSLEDLTKETDLGKFAQNFSSNIDKTKETAQKVGNAALLTTQNLLNSLNRDKIEEEISNLGSAAGNALDSYASKKLEKLRKAWTTTTTITLKALIDEVAPFTLGVKDIGKVLLDKLVLLTSYLLDIENPENGGWGELGVNLADDVISSFASDSATQNALADLSVVKTFASAIETIVNVIDTVKSVLDAVEPLFPINELLAEVANCILNPTYGPVAADKITKMTERAVTKLASQAYTTLKKYIFNIKITVPQLLADILGIMSVKGTTTLNDSNAFLDAFKSLDDTFKEMEQPAGPMSNMSNTGQSDDENFKNAADMFSDFDNSLRSGTIFTSKSGDSNKNKGLGKLTGTAAKFADNVLSQARKECRITIQNRTFEEAKQAKDEALNSLRTSNSNVFYRVTTASSLINYSRLNEDLDSSYTSKGMDPDINIMESYDLEAHDLTEEEIVSVTHNLIS